jgi:DNA-directed RNA polymerase specialized sigma24 family protein
MQNLDRLVETKNLKLLRKYFLHFARSHARKLQLEPDVGESVLHDVLLDQLEKVDCRRSPGEIRAWICRAIIWRLMKIAMKARREQTSAASTARAPQACIGTENQLLDRLVLDQIKQELPTHGRDCEALTMLLLHCNGSTYQEISDQFNVPVGTVKSRIVRVQVKLRTLIARYE